jgi:hypothetical protein
MGALGLVIDVFQPIITLQPAGGVHGTFLWSGGCFRSRDR